MKRSEQIVELMDDVKKIISQMAVVDVCEEEKPVEVGKTIMTSREVADMFQEYHSVTYRRIAQLIVELEPMEQTEFKMAQFKARHQEYPMWELTEKACKLYLARMKRDRCYGKKKTGIEKMEKELRCRVSG
ncbi:MAG: Rha family transcriptional regulator [Mediterraneibacter gnavus]